MHMACSRTARVKHRARVLHNLRQVVTDVAMAAAHHVVVVGVLRKPPVEKGVCQPIHRLLLVLDGPHHNFSHLHEPRHTSVLCVFTASVAVLLTIECTICLVAHLHERYVLPGH
jgi:hypothetical protein